MQIVMNRSAPLAETIGSLCVGKTAALQSFYHLLSEFLTVPHGLIVWPFLFIPPMVPSKNTRQK